MSNIDIYSILSSKHHNEHFLKRYHSFIQNCKLENQTIDDTYTENHHILPESIWPEYKNLKKHKWNNATLTSRQHFIVHWIASKMFQKDTKSAGMMTRAFVLMGAESENQERYVNSRGYEFAKKQMAELQRTMVGMTNRDKTEYKFVPKSKMKDFIEDGWTRGRTKLNVGSVKNYVAMTSPCKTYFIKIQQEQIQKYESQGYNIGIDSNLMETTKDRVWMTDPTCSKSKLFRQACVNEMIEDGWTFGYRNNRNKNSIAGAVWMTNGTNRIHIRPNEVQKYTDLGFRPGSGVKSPYTDTIYITNGADFKRLKAEDAQKFLDNGWVVGISDSHKQAMKGKHVGKIWIRTLDRTASKQISKEKAAELIATGEWEKGRRKSKSRTKPVESHVTIAAPDEEKGTETHSISRHPLLTISSPSVTSHE